MRKDGANGGAKEQASGEREAAMFPSFCSGLTLQGCSQLASPCALRLGVRMRPVCPPQAGWTEWFFGFVLLPRPCLKIVLKDKVEKKVHLFLLKLILRNFTLFIY